MSVSQIKKAQVIENYNNKVMNRKEAAIALGLSERQITRIAANFKRDGIDSLFHGNTNRKPLNALTADTIEKILEIKEQPDFEQVNFSHFRELLLRQYGIPISYTALRNLLVNNGYTSPKKQRTRKKKYTKREPKEFFGELLQIDATPFDWFGTGTNYALHGAIDDNTGMVTALHITENECLQGYTEVMRETILNHGVPLSLYSDKHTIFRSPNKTKNDEKGVDSNLTQFGAALDEMGVNLIFAHSPQAKGKIERLWETLQSRLPVEFKLAGIHTIEQANQFLKETYLALFNEKFAKPVTKNIAVPWIETKDIDTILCIKETRKVDNACTFSFRGKTLRALDNGDDFIPPKATIEVLVNIRFGIRVRYNDKVFATIETVKTKKTAKAPISKEPVNVKPYLVHGTEEWKKIWHSESYQSTLDFLRALFLESVA